MPVLAVYFPIQNILGIDFQWVKRVEVQMGYKIKQRG